MASLTVNVNILPTTYTNVGLTVDAWLASSFLRNPSGQTLPISGAAAATTTTNSSGVATLAGLSAGASYWVRVIDPNGYYHWFPANLSLISTLQANINMPVPGILITPTLSTWPAKFAPSSGLPSGFTQGSAFLYNTAIQNTLKVPLIVYMAWKPTAQTGMDSILVQVSDDGVTYNGNAGLGNTQFSLGSAANSANLQFTVVVPPNAYIKVTYSGTYWTADHWYYSF